MSAKNPGNKPSKQSESKALKSHIRTLVKKLKRQIVHKDQVISSYSLKEQKTYFKLYVTHWPETLSDIQKSFTDYKEIRKEAANQSFIQIYNKEIVWLERQVQIALHQRAELLAEPISDHPCPTHTDSGSVPSTAKPLSLTSHSKSSSSNDSRSISPNQQEPFKLEDFCDSFQKQISPFPPSKSSEHRKQHKDFEDKPPIDPDHDHDEDDMPGLESDSFSDEETGSVTEQDNSQDSSSSLPDEYDSEHDTGYPLEAEEFVQYSPCSHCGADPND